MAKKNKKILENISRLDEIYEIGYEPLKLCCKLLKELILTNYP